MSSKYPCYSYPESNKLESHFDEMQDNISKRIIIGGMSSIVMKRDCPGELQDAYNATGEFLRKPNSYKPFDKTSDGLFIKGCVDPRPEADYVNNEDDMKNSIMKSPGGAFGEAIDTNLSLHNKDLINGTCKGSAESMIVDALLYKRALQPNIIFDAHNAIGHDHAHSGCAYIDNVGSILSAMANPKPDTLEAVNALCDQYKIKLQNVELISKASAALLERSNFVLPSPGRILEIIDGVYPEYSNVRTMDGTKCAYYYTVIHNPKLGFARKDFHNTNPIVRTYADTLGASIRKIHSVGELNNYEKDMKIAARIWRTVATAQVLAESMNYPLRFIEVMSSKGCGNILPTLARKEQDVVRI